MGYIAFNKSFRGKKIIRIHDTNTDITVGVTGSGYDKWYRYPASFLIPEGDPQYSKEGNTANGTYGYMLNSRCWAYDVGLALLMFATSGDWDIVEEMLHRLKEDQNYDGSWNFSYDIYIGKLFHDYVRTGAIGWVVWGICYAILKMGSFGDESYGWRDMVDKAGAWILSKQVISPSDPRYGLLRGGYGIYDNDYNYTDTEIEWCSTEHNCSTLQALHGLSLVTGEAKYKKAAEMVKDAIATKLYDKDNKRFYQGINSGEEDKAWALDCTTWAGSSVFSVLNSDIAKGCRETALNEYMIANAPLVTSSAKNYYNMLYTSSDTFDGFKPYSDRTADYAGAPEIVWSEGTLGYAALCLMLGNTDEAKKYVDEMIKLQNCDNCTGGVLYTTATYAMMPWEFHTWESVVSATWLYLIINNPDVLFPKVLRQVYYIAKIEDIQDERIDDDW